MYLGLGFNYFFLARPGPVSFSIFVQGRIQLGTKVFAPSGPARPVAPQWLSPPPVRLLPPKSPSPRPISQREPQIGAVSTTKAAWGGLSFLDCGKFRALGESGTFRAAISGLTGPP